MHNYALIAFLFFIIPEGSRRGEDAIAIGNPIVSANSATANRKSQGRVLVGGRGKEEEDHPIVRRLMV